MRICKVSPGIYAIPEGGADPNVSIIDNLAHRFTKKGHEVSVIDTYYRPRSKSVYSIYEVKSPFTSPILREVFFSASLTLKLKELIKRERPDIVHAYGALNAFLISNLQLNHVPTVYWAGTPWLSLLDEKGFQSILSLNVTGANRLMFLSSFFLQYFTLKSTFVVIVPTNHIKDNIVEYYCMDPSRIKVIPFGVDTETFSPNRAKTNGDAIRNSYGHGPFIVCIARIAPYKNQLDLVKSIPLVKKEFPQVKYIFVGPIMSQNYFSIINDFTKSNQLEHNVEFVGLKTNLLPYYGVADLVAVPSIAEGGYPLVLLQIMSCGKAIVASAKMVEVSKQGDEIFFVNPKDTRQLADAIIKLLLHSSLRTKLGQAARRTALLYHDWDVIAEAMLRAYEEIIDASKVRSLR